ncbi:MAG: hypothetical protein NC900_06240, partial [Candidatus Omnitrophica bacterium]|nr:hypothetical protein [Candidatus Omnitrophota bacterium]
MLYVKVLVGLPIEGSFDYFVPQHLENEVAVGKRVWIPFRDKKCVGYIIKLTGESKVKKIKPLYKVIDKFPILDKRLLNLAKLISEYYFCYWGEAVDLILPKALREGKVVDIKPYSIKFSSEVNRILLIQDLKGYGRWQIYEKKIKEKLDYGQAVIFLVPEIDEICKVVKKIKERFNEEVVIFNSKQSDRLNLLSWQKVKNGEVKIAVGTRMAVF